MKLRLGKKKEAGEDKGKSLEKKVAAEGIEGGEKKERRKKKKKVEYYGGRWLALGLLLGLMLLSSLFALSGRGGLGVVGGVDLSGWFEGWTEGWGWSRTYEYR